MINPLLLLSGHDIPFPSAQINIHQPTIKEIAMIGEDNFFIGYEFLSFTKDKIADKDRSDLQNKSNFDIILSMMKTGQSLVNTTQALSGQLVLTLLFPQYAIQVRKDHIALIPYGDNPSHEEKHLNNANYTEFQEILNKMFYFYKNNEEKKFNPKGSLAEKIANKIKKGRNKVAQLKHQDEQSISILFKYISILAVGEHKDMNTLMNYTVYQLNEEFHRYRLKSDYDLYVRLKLAGAQDLKEVQNWVEPDIQNKK